MYSEYAFTFAIWVGCSLIDQKFAIRTRGSSHRQRKVSFRVLPRGLRPRSSPSTPGRRGHPHPRERRRRVFQAQGQPWPPSTPTAPTTLSTSQKKFAPNFGRKIFLVVSSILGDFRSNFRKVPSCNAQERILRIRDASEPEVLRCLDVFLRCICSRAFSNVMQCCYCRM